MRPSSRAPVLVLLTLGWVLAAATASAQSAYYLRRGGLLALDPPAANSTAAVVSASLPSGGAALLASFASATLTADVLADGVAADLYLGTGKSGMNGCASISVTLSRTHGTTSTVVATGDLTTSIGPRHDITGPIGVPLTAGQPLLAATGERLVFAVRVANHCAEARTVSLLYDAPERASALAMTPVAPTSTTSTTVLPGASTTSTTTLAPLDCLATAAGLAAVDCRLTRIQEMLQAASPSSRAESGAHRRSCVRPSSATPGPGACAGHAAWCCDSAPRSCAATSRRRSAGPSATSPPRQPTLSAPFPRPDAAGGRQRTLAATGVLPMAALRGRPPGRHPHAARHTARGW
jgi:hypothetical protein